jgi:hypothetical protein
MHDIVTYNPEDPKAHNRPILESFRSADTDCQGLPTYGINAALESQDIHTCLTQEKR